MIQERLKAIIAYTGLNDSAFAKKIGVQQITLWRQINDQRKISLDTIMAVADTFPEIDANWLLRGNGTMLANNEEQEKRLNNLIDLARINFNECQDTLHYIRTKTERKPKVNPFVEFEIPDVAKEIIAKYKQPDGTLLISGSNKREHCQYFIGPSHQIRLKLGFKDLTFYSARKSFAQHAFSLGISESVIDYVLGHSLGGSSNKMLYSYIKVTPDMATECVRKVCDFIASSENF